MYDYADMSSLQQGTGRESRHLWVGGLPDSITEVGIKDYFSKFGKIEGVKILPQKYPNVGVAAFIDFCDVQSAIEAHETQHKLGGNDLRTNFKAKATEKYDANKKRVNESPEKASKDQQQIQGSSSSSSGSDTDDSSSSSCTSSDQYTTNGKKSKRRETDEISTLFLKVTGLANRPERVLQDGLYYEFCRYSPNAVVRMYGDVSEKLSAVVKYNRVECCREAMAHSQGMVLFGSKLKLVPLEVDDFPAGGRDQPIVSYVRHSPVGDVDPQATRSLFVGNIPKNISIYELRDIFQRFGNVLDVEIKKMGGNATYGFVLYYDLLHAVSAKQCMDGQNVKGNSIRVGFGKGTPSKTLWIDGIDPLTTEVQLERQIVKYGKVIRLGIDRPRRCAMIQYDNADSAKDALNSLKGSFIGNSKRLMTDFANRDARAAFFSRVEEGESSGHVRSFSGPPPMFGPGMVGHRGGVMMPRGRVPMMGVGRGGYPFPGHPVDYYFNPYLDENVDLYGGGRPPYHHGIGPVHVRRYDPQGSGRLGQVMDDYEEELRAFSRKREWEREREKHKKRPSVSPSCSEDEKSRGSGSQLKRKRHKKLRSKNKGTLPNDSEDEDDSRSEEIYRQTATHGAKEEKNVCDIGSGISSPDESEERTLLVQETEKKYMQKAEGIYDDSSDSNEKSSPFSETTNFKHSDLTKKSIEECVGEEKMASSEEPRVSSVLPKDLIDDIHHSALESPQSPVVKSDHGRLKVESDLSSDEDFECVDNVASAKHEVPSSESSNGKLRHGPNASDTKQGNVCTPTSKTSMSGEEPECKIPASKKPRLVPKQYQVEEEMGIQKRGLCRLQDVKESSRFERRHPSPRSPSPRGHCRKYHHSPPPQYGEKRWYQRDRPLSPGMHTLRKFSHSPPGYPGSPPHRHYSTSPPLPRTRSPPRGRDRGPPRYRYESPPPFDGGRGKYNRRGSPPPHSRYPYSPSPPPRFRSPIGRRFGWHRSPSFSPPRRSPKRISRRDKSPVQRNSQASPHHSADNYYETSKGYRKRPVYSKTPSPKLKCNELGNEDNPSIKRQKVLEEHNPKSPAPVPPILEENPVKAENIEQQQSKQAPDHKSVSSWQKSGDSSSDHKSPDCLHPEFSQQPELEATQPFNNLLELLRRYPVMWQGHLTLKNDLTAVQLHFLSGNAELAKMSLPPGSDKLTPTLRIAQRMRLEKSQLDEVERRIQNEAEHCLLLALPCGRDADDVHIQTQNLKNGLISYLLQKQAAGIINIQGNQGSNGYVLHIFPPCSFSQSHLSQVAPDLSSASDNCHLMIVAAMV